MANVVDFLQKAKARDIRVILVLNYTPQSPYYLNQIQNSIESTATIAGEHRYLLTRGGHQAKADYVNRVVTALKNWPGLPVGELLPTVLAYDLHNEVAVTEDQPPYSLNTNVLFGDNVIYNMNPTAANAVTTRQQSFDANVVRWASMGRAAAKAVDPSALVTVSVFSHAAVGLPGPTGVRPPPAMVPASATNAFRSASGNRHPARPLILQLYAGLDFVDVHMYRRNQMVKPGQGGMVVAPYTMTDELNSIEFNSMNLGDTGTPVVLGEFGAFVKDYCGVANGALTAAPQMKAYRDEAKAKGFKGALFWTWNTIYQNDDTDCTKKYQWWNAVDASGAINWELHWAW